MPIHIHIHLHLVLEKTLVMDAGRFPSRLNLMEGAFCQQVQIQRTRPVPFHMTPRSETHSNCGLGSRTT